MTWEGWVFDIVVVLAFGLIALTLAVRRWKGEPAGRD